MGRVILGAIRYARRLEQTGDRPNLDSLWAAVGREHPGSTPRLHWWRGADIAWAVYLVLPDGTMKHRIEGPLWIIHTPTLHSLIWVTEVITSDLDASAIPARSTVDRVADVRVSIHSASGPTGQDDDVLLG